jgi:uracil-DNA glycosylase family 4
VPPSLAEEAVYGGHQRFGVALAGDEGKTADRAIVTPKGAADKAGRGLDGEEPQCCSRERAPGATVTTWWQTSGMDASSELQRIAREASTCTRCRLSAGRTNVVFGMGSPTAALMFVGEGPGEQEDLQGLPFVGRSGQLLDRLMLEEIGITREDCYIGNCVKCRPPGNRDPEPDEIEACRPYLEAQLDLVKPKVVVALGNFATRTLLGTSEPISRVRGRVYPYRTGYLVPTFHPSAALRGSPIVVAQMRADFVRAKEALWRAQRAAPDE